MVRWTQDCWEALRKSAPELRTLEMTLTPSQIMQLAVDRTALSHTVVLSANRALGERWQLMLDLAALRLGGTPASGGVPATPAAGLDKNVNRQVSGSDLLQANDLHIFGVRVDEGRVLDLQPLQEIPVTLGNGHEFHVPPHSQMVAHA